MEMNSFVHIKLANLLDLWNAKRGDRSMPSRADFDPINLHEWLGNLVLIDIVEGGRDFRVRLHGSRLAWACGDLTGKSAATLLSDAVNAVTSDCARAAADKVPLFAYYRQTIGKTPIEFGAVILPLSDDGETVTMLLMAAYPGST